MAEPLPNSALLDRSTTHQVYLLRLGGQLANESLAVLNSGDEEVVRLIEGEIRRIIEAPLRQQRDMIARLFARVAALDAEVYALVERELGRRLAEVAAYEAEFQRRLLQQVAGGEWAPGVVARDLLDETAILGRTLAERIADSRSARQRSLQGLIRDSARSEERARRFARRLEREMDRARRHVDTTARTHTQGATDFARREVWQANDDKVRLEYWASVLDGSTTPGCSALDGETRRIGGHVWSNGVRAEVPRHYGCRSVVVALLAGVVPDKLTYGEWFDRQEAELQREILGRDRYKLYRAGVRDFDRFVDTSGKTLTIDELARKESAAFERAGLAA